MYIIYIFKFFLTAYVDTAFIFWANISVAPCPKQASTAKLYAKLFNN